MKKVLLLASMPPDCGGIATWSQMVCDFSKSKNSDVTIVPISVGQTKVPSTNIKFYQRVFWGFLDMRRVIKEMKKTLANVDIVHFSSTGGLSLFRDKKIIKIAKKYKKPLIMHIHFGRMPQIKEKGKWEWKLFLWNFSNVNKIITIDKKTNDSIADLYPEKVVEIQNPIDTNKLNLLAGLGTNHPFNGKISFLGWVIKEKGIEELIAAFNMVLEKYSNLSLCLIGPYKHEYYEYLNNSFNLKNVTFFGEKENIEALRMIKESELFVFPSYTEGCPNVILEAMLCKTPIIASSVGAIPEMIDNGCGIIIPPQNVNEVANSIIYLLENKAIQTQMTNKAFEKVLINYSLESVFTKYNNLWNLVFKS